MKRRAHLPKTTLHMHLFKAACAKDCGILPTAISTEFRHLLCRPHLDTGKAACNVCVLMNRKYVLF
jgi:hypothetical protein